MYPYSAWHPQTTQLGHQKKWYLLSEQNRALFFLLFFFFWSEEKRCFTCMWLVCYVSYFFFFFKGLCSWVSNLSFKLSVALQYCRGSGQDLEGEFKPALILVGVCFSSNTRFLICWMDEPLHIRHQRYYSTKVTWLKEVRFVY